MLIQDQKTKFLNKKNFKKGFYTFKFK